MLKNTKLLGKTSVYLFVASLTVGGLGLYFFNETNPLLKWQTDKNRPVSADSSSSSSSSSLYASQETREDIPEFDKDNPVAKGVILKFSSMA